MDETKGTAPNLNQLFHNIMPHFERTIKELISDIKDKAKIACEGAKGTAAQKAVCEINREIQELTIGSQDYMIKQVQTLYTNLKSSVPDKEEYKLIHQEIDSILNEGDLVNQYSSLNMLLPKIIQINVVEATASVSDEIRLLRESVDKLTQSVDELPNPQEYLNTIQQNLEQIKDEIPEMKKQIDDVLYELYSPAGIDQKLKVAIPIIPLLASYEVETNPSKFVADRIFELKKLVLGTKK
jgi:DNA repair ATPase RecN